MSHSAGYSFSKPISPEVKRLLAEDVMMSVPMTLIPTHEQIYHYRQFLMTEANFFMEGPPDLGLLEKRRRERPASQAARHKKKGKSYEPHRFEYPDDDPYYADYEQEYEDSYISSQGSVTRHKAMGVYGTLWTSHEKEIFFEFLGRYGIRQVEKLQKRLLNKSLTQIMCYYELLQRELAHHKQTTGVQELVKYDEMPEAVETHPLVVRLEEEMSTKMDLGMVWTKPPKELTTGHQFVAVDGLKQCLEFMNLPHLRFSRKRELKMKMNFQSFGELRKVIDRTTRTIVQRIVKTKIHGEMEDHDRETTIESGVLSYTVSENDVYKAVVQCDLKRPLTKRSYFQALDDRLSFQTIDHSLPLSGKLDSYGRDKGQYTGVPLEPMTLHKRQKLERFVENKLHTGDSTIDYMKVHPEQYDIRNTRLHGSFIFDDYTEDQILDNPVAWYMLMKESEAIDKEHEPIKLAQTQELLQKMGLTQEFETRLPAFQQRHDREVEIVNSAHRSYLKDRFRTMFAYAHGDNHEEKVEYLLQKHGETRDVLIDRELFIAKGQEGLLAQTDPINIDRQEYGKEVTEEMMLAFNYTFASYK